MVSIHYAYIEHAYTHPLSGSMHVLPGSHKDGVYKHDSDSNVYIEYGMVQKPNQDDVSDVLTM